MAAKKTGRPRKPVKEINPVRQVGRWDDESWSLVQRAAKKSGKNVAAWARDKLLRAAKRELKE